MTEPDTTAQNTLRGDILAMGRDDYVSMADVQGQISRGRLADSVAERQQLVLDTVRSLLVDGLVEVGVIPTPGSPGFKAWPGTLDDVMARFADCFVAHYDDRRGWEYAIWFNLTTKGQQVSAEFVDDR
jgi:hypothetical protein